MSDLPGSHQPSDQTTSPAFRLQPGPPPPPFGPPPKKRTKVWPWLAAGGALAVLICVAGTVLAAGNRPTSDEPTANPVAKEEIRIGGPCGEHGRTATAVDETIVRCEAGQWRRPVVEAQPVLPTVPPPTAPPAQPKPAPTIDEGIWTVGEDIPPGTYKVTAKADSMCYWARLKPNGDIIDNYIGGGLPKVTIRKGEQFETSGCPTWKKVG